MPEKPTSSEKHRIAFYARAKESVRAKLVKAYATAPEDFKPPATLITSIDTYADSFLANNDWCPSIEANKWQKTLTMAMQSANVPQENIPKIEAVAKETIKNYMEAFWVRRCVYNQKDSAIDASREGTYIADWGRTKITSIYINHISNLAEAKLRDAGLDLESAHITHEVLILVATKAYMQFLNAHSIHHVHELRVDPQQGPRARPHVDKVAAVKELNGYWRKETEALTERFSYIDR